ncbi:MAG: Rho termination protein, partial [Dolichospermum sp.]
SMQHVPGSAAPEQALSSYVFPSGVGMWAVPNVSGLNMSGVGMSGFSAGAVPARPRKFWLVADAELIVYGATEPDANVTIAGRPIKLNADCTFRFQMSFQDGLIDYPILAIAADGEQSRSIHMKFERETPSRHTNTKDEAVLEWLA